MRIASIHGQGGIGNETSRREFSPSLVPKLRLGMPFGMLRIRISPGSFDAERRGRHSQAELGNEGQGSFHVRAARAKTIKLVVLTCSIVMISSPSRGGEPDLGLADLAAYRAALKSSPSDPAVAVTFRDLWDHPDRYEGRKVRVEGTLMRRFRQGAVGEFSPLVEAWANSPARDPFCLVFPESADASSLNLGDLVRFEGTFLRKVRYRGVDTERLAPLIVGNLAPTVLKTASKTAPRPFTGERLWLDGTATFIVGFIVLGAVARTQMRRPRPRSLELEPAPEFLERTN